MKEIDHEYTSSVICPYCGYDNGADADPSDLAGRHECGECEKKFECEPIYDVSYTTRKMPCWNDEPHKWRVHPPFAPEDAKTVRTCRECMKSEWVAVEDRP